MLGGEEAHGGEAPLVWLLQFSCGVRQARLLRKPRGRKKFKGIHIAQLRTSPTFLVQFVDVDKVLVCSKHKKKSEKESHYFFGVYHVMYRAQS